MTRHAQTAASGMHRFVLVTISMLATVLVLLGAADSVASFTIDSLGSPACFLDEAPAGDRPPAEAPAIPLLAEFEIAPEGETEFEDGGDYSWPSFSHDRTCTANHVVALHADGIDAPRFFVDAADLSRSCRLTL